MQCCIHNYIYFVSHTFLKHEQVWQILGVHAELSERAYKKMRKMAQHRCVDSHVLPSNDCVTKYGSSVCWLFVVMLLTF